MEVLNFFTLTEIPVTDRQTDRVRIPIPTRSWEGYNVIVNGFVNKTVDALLYVFILGT